jgi:hypothetical protein
MENKGIYERIQYHQIEMGDLQKFIGRLLKSFQYRKSLLLRIKWVMWW